MTSETDISGKVFGRLTVISRADGYPKHDMWECKCSCGNDKVIYGYDLRTEKTKSCGCLRSELLTTHGMHKTRFYSVWSNMIERCRNKNAPNYHYYGGRGISVCEKWKSFEGFKEDLYESYVVHSEKYGESDTTIERLDVDDSYKLSNVTWATMRTQAKNKRLNRNNTSGHPGVSWMNSKQKWRARISLDRKECHIGVYDSLEEAIKAREKALLQLEGERLNEQLSSGE
jgi:hypothetical protein